ncbi:hypothetical protein C7271_22210 [filamentous cyanobacterium CCP5]|nr:hypothetical protein C7271_22210 [filamentous cyanobacterium CCP5]
MANELAVFALNPTGIKPLTTTTLAVESGSLQVSLDGGRIGATVGGRIFHDFKLLRAKARC